MGIKQPLKAIIHMTGIKLRRLLDVKRESLVNVDINVMLTAKKKWYAS
jgi:hypothetical protein